MYLGIRNRATKHVRNNSATVLQILTTEMDKIPCNEYYNKENEK